MGFFDLISVSISIFNGKVELLDMQYLEGAGYLQMILN